VIAVVGAHRGLLVKAQPEDRMVHVLGRKELAPWLQRRPQVLSAADVEAIFEQARRSTTWRV